MFPFSRSDEIKGILLIYVDDLLLLSETKMTEAVYKWLTEEWKCSSLQWMAEEYLRFLGVELRLMGNGIHVSQAGYIRDLLRQHGVPEKPGSLTVPCAREWLQDEESHMEVKPAEEAVIRLAQQATGEILWLSTKSRPELSHPVACMASRATRNPAKVLEIAKRVMNYLSKTVEYGLHYVKDEEETLLTVYSDASYAPGGGRSFGCIMAQVAGMPVCWKAAKQPIATLSDAEAEMYKAVSSVQLGLDVEAMLNESGERPVIRLKIDNAAVQGLASEAPGSWKTRHLRLCARFLCQEVAAQRLTISHVPGDLHKADLGTKGFDVPKFKSLRGLLRIIPFEIVEVTEIAMKTAKKRSNESLLMFIMVCYMIVQGARVSVNEDLQLDGSLELYVVVGLGIVACVAIWEMVKKIADMGKSWWMSWQRKQRRLERLRTKAEAAVNEELRRRLHHETSAPRTTSATTSRPFSHFHFHTQSDLAIMQLTSVCYVCASAPFAAAAAMTQPNEALLQELGNGIGSDTPCSYDRQFATGKEPADPFREPPVAASQPSASAPFAAAAAMTQPRVSIGRILSCL
ncbi:GIP [Symbiodinium necroappetens]|uniref:GIP protein n=1 Tax=Symbiodinium necroappetens TaxID=1628268 RepID=A0A812PDF8_9DINO|nr:GIP [Symbiodinium necroappetens]